MHSESIVAWLSTFVLHACALLAIAWSIDRGVLRTRPAWRELLWRTALFGAVLTASLQTSLDLHLPTRFVLPTTQAVTASQQFAASDAAHDTASSSETKVVHDRTPNENHRFTSEKPARVAPALATTWPSSAATNLDRSTALYLLLVAWLTGSLFALWRLCVCAWRLERALAGAQFSRDTALPIEAATLARHAGIAVPRLCVLDDLASPFVARGLIVLPCWAVDLLDRPQLRAMLAHEIAHLARRDPVWKFAAAVACVPLWFLPLARLACRRLDEVAELACDAWAACRIGGGRPLAECLAECAERGFDGFESALAPAMAQRDSPLLQRIDHLLGATPLNTTLSHLRAVCAVTLALALGVVVLPGIGSAGAQTAPPVPAQKSSSESHAHISSDISLFGKKHEFTKVEISNDGRSYRAEIKGAIAFTEHDDDVASLDDGGSASFAQTQSNEQRRIDYSSHAGKIERHYFIDDHEQPIDAAVQAWIAGILPVVIRNTAIGAEARVKRLYASGGANAVLDEIGRIDSDYARDVYLKQLIAIAKLAPAEVTRVLSLIDGIGSDYERRNALAALSAAAPLDATQQKLVVGQAAKIGSDYERAELLVGMLPTLAPDAGLREAWLQASAGIGSDYEHRRTLKALLDAQPLDDATLGQIIVAANSIGSDYERRELLVAAVQRVGDGERIAVPYAAAVGGIGSDYERREALLALIRAPKFGAGAARAVLDAANSIGSDYECREVLVALARVMPDDAGLITRYRDVAKRLSDSDRGAAERALDRFTS